MLTRLSISNIVLIERLDLEFGAGLNILTGETGAGKSILLDALALALGARSDAGLVRHGCDNASVIAEFEGITSATLHTILDDVGIEFDGTLILRRVLSADGKSRAWINDAPVSVKTLKQVGDALVEIHGQFANHAMLNPSTHRASLDTFAAAARDDFAALRNDVRHAYNDFYGAKRRLNELTELLEKSAMEREFLQHNVAELDALKPMVGEEEELATRRADLMNAEKNAAILGDAMAAMNGRGNSLDAMVFSVAHILERIKTDPNPYATQIDRLYEIAQNLAEISDSLQPEEADANNLDAIEERLFALRAAARKHRVTADELVEKLAQMRTQLDAIDNSDAEMTRLQSDVKKYEAAFTTAAKKLTDARVAAGEVLRTQLLCELPDLKLGSADFMVECTPAAPSAGGADDILFMIKTNPGTPFAPLHKSASGGELARLMLAMRVVLTDRENAPTFIFDEVDTGISGATASAVGCRLNKLAAGGQAIVITHSAQVAGYADRHFKISKSATDGITKTTVVEITGDARTNEIARIISGAEITPESLSMAKTLMKH